jgi:hypothetical protein
MLDSFEDLPGRSQAAIVKAKQRRPSLRLISNDYASRRQNATTLANVIPTSPPCGAPPTT